MILRVFATSVGAPMMLLTLAFGFAIGVATLSGIDAASLALAYFTGGLPEMSLIALSLEIGVAFVVIHHMGASCWSSPGPAHCSP